MKLKHIVIYILLPLFSTALCAQEKPLQANGADSTRTALFFNALRDYNSGSYADAGKNFQKLLTIDPENDAAYYYLANIALRTDDTASGELYLKKGIELDSSNYWYMDMLGQIYIKNKKLKEAIGVYEQLLEMYPKKSAVYYSLVNLYLGAQETENAKEILRKIEASQGKSEGVALTYFNIYRMEQNWEGALNYLIEFDKEFQSPRVECLIADMYADRYKDSLAIKYYDKALETDRQYAPAMYGRAEVYRMKGDYGKFFEDIKPFLSNPSIDPQMKTEYMKQLFQVPNFMQRFRTQLDSIMLDIEAAHPADTTSNIFLASYWGQGGNNERCKKLLRRNHLLYPDKYSTLFQYIIAIYQLEEWDTLEQETTEALKKYPKDPDMVQLRGIARFQQKKTDAAIESYREMGEIALARKDTAALVTSYSVMGDLYYEKKDSKNAFASYRKALKLNPNENGVLNNYAYYLALEGKNLKLAYQMSRKTIESEPDNPTYLDTFGWILFLMDKPLEAKAQFKHAMLYGGTESAAILDHYAEVLFKLGEQDLAFIYWNQAKQMDSTLGIEEKIKERKSQMKK
ncbi:MAG: tetratricopeptide repeat protein [Bacteroidales bacterium]|nr:tetratricopeptide repeat protein [Bacteroidales bacterium]